jgi:tetratricopeptide (TPR) repeat protein
LAIAHQTATPESRQGEIGRGLPVLMFLILAALVWFGGKVVADPAWMKTALENGLAVRQRGASLWDLLQPVSDPRLIISSILVALGLPASLTLILIRLSSILFAAGAVFLVAGDTRLRGRFDRAGAWFLAVSPLWIKAAVDGEPALVLGLIFLMLACFRLPIWVRLGLLGWACGWNSWAWLALPFLLLARNGENSRLPGGRVSALVLAIPLVLILNPLALKNPIGWWDGMIHQIVTDGFWSAGSHVGTTHGLWPLVTTIHFAGLLLLLIAAFYWPERLRRLEAAPVAFLLVLALGARSAYADGTMLLLLLPWACYEIGTGWIRLRGVLIGKLKPYGIALLMLCCLIPAALKVNSMAPPPVQTAGQQEAAANWLETNLPAGALVVHDMGFKPPANTDLVYLALPFHAMEPQIYRGAYWRGWYPMAHAYVLSERMVIRLLKEPGKSAHMLNFFQALTTESESDIAFGIEIERRTRVLLVTPPDEPILGDDWRRRLASGPAGGIDGNWLATLGLAYLELGHSPLTAQLLEEAIGAGFSDLGIYINLANAFTAIGRTNAAGRFLDEASMKYPNSPELLYNLGVVLVKGERWNRAVSTLARLQGHWPQSAEVALMLGLAMINDEHPVNAGQQLRKALTLNPTAQEKAEIERLLQLLESRQP